MFVTNAIHGKCTVFHKIQLFQSMYSTDENMSLEENLISSEQNDLQTARLFTTDTWHIYNVPYLI